MLKPDKNKTKDNKKTEGNSLHNEHLELLIAKNPFDFCGVQSMSFLGDYDYITGRIRVPCTTTISQSAIKGIA